MALPLVARSLLLGCAAGARSSLGPGGPTISGRHRPLVRSIAALGVLGEIVADKLPVAPSRLAHGGALVRAASGAIGGALLARRVHAGTVAPALVGALGGLAGAYGERRGEVVRAFPTGRPRS